MSEPVGNGGDKSAIFRDMLLTNETNGYFPSVAVCDSCPKESFSHEDPFGVMSQSSVPEVSEVTFRFIEPAMDRRVIFRLTSPLLDATEGMVVRMCHQVFPSDNRDKD